MIRRRSCDAPLLVGSTAWCRAPRINQPSSSPPVGSPAGGASGAGTAGAAVSAGRRRPAQCARSHASTLASAKGQTPANTPRKIVANRSTARWAEAAASPPALSGPDGGAAAPGQIAGPIGRALCGHEAGRRSGWLIDSGIGGAGRSRGQALLRYPGRRSVVKRPAGSGSRFGDEPRRSGQRITARSRGPEARSRPQSRTSASLPPPCAAMKRKTKQ